MNTGIAHRNLPMPISANVFVRSTTLLLAVAFLALATIVGTTIWLVETNNYWFNETTSARVARTVTVGVRNALQDAETGQRGFLLTGEDSYLAPYEAALPTIPSLLDRLEQVLAPYPEADGVAAMVRANSDSKLAELAETIALARAGRIDQALEVVRTDRGKDDMDALRTMFAANIEAADARTAEGLEYQRNGTVALRWVTIVGALIILSMVNVRSCLRTGFPPAGSSGIHGQAFHARTQPGQWPPCTGPHGRGAGGTVSA